MTIAARLRFREMMRGSELVYPMSVFDPISARIAQSLGSKAGIMGGSVASATLLAAPDLLLVTLTELAEHVRRTTSAAPGFPVMMDGDHGFGNALNVMRTVREMESAGAASVSIEDTVLPLPFGQADEGDLISKHEMLGKLEAALSARTDKEFTIVGRTSAFSRTSEEEAMERTVAYSKTGVDALMLLGKFSYESLSKIHKSTGLPILISLQAPLSDLAKLAQCGVRVVYRGHLPFYVALQALYDSMKLMEEGKIAEVRAKMAAQDLTNSVLQQEEFKKARRSFLEKKS